MVDAVQQGKLAPFTTIKYVTKDGENCTATKNNGVVTVIGDKSGMRQLPLDKFMKEFVETLPKVNLENSPAKDTVTFSGNPENDGHKMSKIKILGALGAILVGAGIYILSKGKAKKVSPAIDDLTKKADDMVDTAVNTAKEQIKPVVETVETSIKESAAQAKEKIQPVVDKAKETLKPAVEKAGEIKDKAKTDFMDIVAEVFPGNKNILQPASKPVPKASAAKPAKIEPEAAPAKKKASAAKTKSKAKSEEIKPELKPAKTQETPKEPLKNEQFLQDDIQKSIEQQQKQAQKLAEQQQKEQQIIDDNNMIAAAVLFDDGLLSKGTVIGHKPVVALADDAGKAVKDELHIADDLLADVHVGKPKSNPWDEPVDFMTGNGSKAVEEVDLLAGAHIDKPKSNLFDEPVDYFQKNSSYDGIDKLDDMFPTSHIDDIGSDLEHTFNDFNNGLDDIGSGFDDFGGGDIF